MMAALYEEIIDEIGTQTLARFGLNIFSLNTYSAYEASIVSTNAAAYIYERQNKSKNENETEEQIRGREASLRGHAFEVLDVGQKNIKNALFNKNEKTYTTDQIADIKRVSEIIKSGKKYDNLSPKDQAKVDLVVQNYSQEEIDSIVNNKNLNFTKNDQNTDVVTISDNGAGEVINKSQHKVVKKTTDLLKDKYLKNNDVITVPFDDYKLHRKNLEEMINDPKVDDEQRKRAREALDKLNRNNMLNRYMCENPRTTAVVTQSIVATGHIAQAGVSDAVVVALSTLANGAIFEIKDALQNDSTPILERIKRLLKRVIEEFNRTFKRGASFGTLDVGVGILSQIFNSFSNKIKTIWRGLRDSFKSIFNAIYSYITGEIKSYRDLMSAIIKGIMSAIVAVGAVALEVELETFLLPIVGQPVASVLAPAMSIVVGSIAVVVSMKSIDSALNALFGVIAQRDLTKMQAEQVHALCEELLPSLIEDREKLEKLIEEEYKERRLTFEKSFNDFKIGLSNCDADLVIGSLAKINSMYGAKLQYSSFEEFDKIMLSDEPLKM